MIRHTVAAVASILTLTVQLMGAAQAQEVVRVGHLSITADGPVYIALEKGYFKERGIDVKLDGFTSAAVAMAPLSTGEIHVAGGGINPALFNAFARAFPVRVVAHRTRDVEGNSVDAIMVRADLKGQVSQVADLRGKRVTINAPAAPGHYLLAKALETAGLTLKDVTLVYMPWPDTAAAFATKAIDAAVIVEPFVTQYEDKNVAFTLKRASDILKSPAWDVAVLFYNDDWAKKNPRVANEFLTAYLKGARDLVEAVGGRNRKEIVDILVKHTRVKDPALYDRMHWGFVDPNGAILKESLRDQQDFYVRQGTVPKAIDIDSMLDERYLKYALEKLGTHK